MNRRDPVILIQEPELVSSGLWPDRHALQTPLWERAENVRFAGGKVQRRVPNSLAFTPAGNPVRGMGQLQDSDGVRWIYAMVGGDLYRWYGPAPTLLQAGAIFVANQNSTQMPTYWDFTAWGNWMIVNEKSNGAKIYKPGVGYAVLGGSAPQDAVQYLKKRNQLLAIGHGNNGRLVSFSDADNIEDWVATPTNLAGEIPLEEANTPVRAACHFGQSVAVFTENQMFGVSWTGAPFYYGQQKLLDGIGAVGKMAVVSDGRLVYGVSRNGVWKTDGVTPAYIDEVVIRDYLQDNVNWDQSAKIIARKNDISGCIEFSFPMGSSLICNEAWAYDPRYGGWSPVPAFEVMEGRVLFDKPLQGTSTGRIELIEDNWNAAGDLNLETRALLLQRDNQAMHIGAKIDEVEVLAHKAENVEFDYGVSESPDGPFMWAGDSKGWFQLGTDQVTYIIDPMPTGVYHKLRFRNYETNWSLDLQGFALFGVAEGQKRTKL